MTVSDDVLKKLVIDAGIIKDLGIDTVASYAKTANVSLSSAFLDKEFKTPYAGCI